MSGMTVDEKQLQIDKDAADTYLRKYERHLALEKEATGQMLNSAIEKFYKFLDIPPASNRYLDILSGAWALASAFIPLLGGVKMAENLFVLCVKAEDLTVKLAPAMRAGQRIASRLDKISPKIDKGIEIAKKSKETYTTTTEAIEKMTKENPEPTKAFANIDIAKQIRIDFVNTLFLRMASIDKADAALHGEYANRMNGVKSNPDPTLAVMAARLLPIPADLSQREYDQLEFVLLYKTVCLYVQKNVTFIRKVLIETSQHVRMEDREPDWTIDNVNSNQMALFAEWFGGISNRGRFFNPPLFKIPVESEEEFFRRTMKMLNCTVVDSVERVNYGRHAGEI